METERDYMINIELTKLINSRIVEVPDEMGGSSTGIFIPIAENGLKLTNRKKVFMQCGMYKKASYFGQTHYISLNCQKETYKILKDMGLMQRVRFMGNAVPIKTILQRKVQKAKMSDLDKITENI